MLYFKPFQKAILATPTALLCIYLAQGTLGIVVQMVQSNFRVLECVLIRTHVLHENVVKHKKKYNVLHIWPAILYLSVSGLPHSNEGLVA